MTTYKALKPLAPLIIGASLDATNRARTHEAGLVEVNEGTGLMTTREEAIAHKQKAASAQATAAVKIWNVTVVPDATAAADFLNLPTAQVAGEAFVSNRADGQVDVYYFP